MNNILIVEDDREIAFAISEYLKNKGYNIAWASTGREGLLEFRNNKYNLLIVDIMMPEMDGYSLCKNIRLLSDIPIIIISAKTSHMDKVKGLNLGADDYIAKPFSLIELEARIEANLRRYNGYKKNDKIKNIKYNNNLTIDKDNREILIGGNNISLTNKEFELFNLLRNNPRKIFSKRELYENIWGEKELKGNNTVTVHIRSLREKLDEDIKRPKFIETVWGKGYRFIGKKL